MKSGIFRRYNARLGFSDHLIFLYRISCHVFLYNHVKTKINISYELFIPRVRVHMRIMVL